MDRMRKILFLISCIMIIILGIPTFAINHNNLENSTGIIHLQSDYIYLRINKKYLENVKKGYEYKTYFTKDKEKIEIPLCIEEETDNEYIVRTLKKYKKYICNMINDNIKIQTEDETRMPFIWCDTTLREVD